MTKRILGLALALMAVWIIPAYSADIQPVKITGGYYWPLVTTAVSATADTDVMVGTLNCDKYSMFVTASGTVSITAAVKAQSSMNTSDVATIKTYTLSSATTTGYTWAFPTPRMYLTLTVTTGQIDRVVIYCMGR